MPQGNASETFAWVTAMDTYDLAHLMEEGIHYNVFDGKYKLLRNGGPVDDYSLPLEYVKFSKTGVPPVLKTTYYYQNIPYLLSQYECITGFSGSLGSEPEREFLRNQYSAWDFDTPSFLTTCSIGGTNVVKHPPSLMCEKEAAGAASEEKAVHVYAEYAEQRAKVVKMCLDLHQRVPVVVICRNSDEAITIRNEVRTALKELLANRGVCFGAEEQPASLQLFLEFQEGTAVSDEHHWAGMVRKAVTRVESEENRFFITITDPFGGRGQDFDVSSDEVQSNGGLAVIITSIPTSRREWLQWLGRTARKDCKGQYAVVLCEKDQPVVKAKERGILNDRAIRNSTNQAIPNIYTEEIIQNLLDLQDANQKQTLDDLTTAIVSGRRLNRLCDVFWAKFGPLHANNWPRTDEGNLYFLYRITHLIILCALCLQRRFSVNYWFKTKLRKV